MQEAFKFNHLLVEVPSRLIKINMERQNYILILLTKFYNTVLWGSVKAPEEFSEGKSEAAKPKIPQGPSPCPLAQCRPPRNLPEGAVFSSLAQGFSIVAQTIKIIRLICRQTGYIPSRLNLFFRGLALSAREG